jgi:hypothetical protein
MMKAIASISNGLEEAVDRHPTKDIDDSDTPLNISFSETPLAFGDRSGAEDPPLRSSNGSGGIV